MPRTQQALIAIVGPTAVGKSTLALHLARVFGGEIVNADSRQVYRRMDIGTAKPTTSERLLAPHHLIDITEPDGEFSLALFLRLARRAIGDVGKRGRLPLVVGGTGQYLWALLEGWRVPRVPPDPRLRARLEARARQEGTEALYRELERVDPEAVRRIDARNLRRVIRALEVASATGVPSRRRRPQTLAYDALVLGLSTSRQELYRRIDARVGQMMQQGFLEEVQGLLERGYDPDLPSLSSLGYRELMAHLRGELSLEEAVQRIKLQSHRFARHQYAWFRLTDPRIRWLQVGPDLLGQAEEQVRRFLAERSDQYGTMA